LSDREQEEEEEEEEGRVKAFPPSEMALLGLQIEKKGLAEAGQ
jgi:hypothetical protein